MAGKTFYSVVWSAIERFGTQLFQGVFTIILARLLMPADYGLVAMIFIFLMIGQMLMDGGLSLALVQKKNPTDDDFSTVFWFNILFGLFFYVVFVSFAPLIARFYEQPQLVPLIKIAGLNLIAWSLGVAHGTKLDISLDFKKQAYITITSLVISGLVGIVMAHLGYGVWALITQYLLNNTLRSLAFWVFGPRWHPRLVFKMASLKSLFQFGGTWILSSLLDTIYKNMYAVFIGKRYTPTRLGFFQQSYSFSNLVTTNVAYTIVRAFIPLHASLNDNPDEQSKLFYRFLSLSGFIVFPIAMLFAVLVEPFVSVVLTDKWLPTVPYIQILCMAYLSFPVLVTNGRMLLSKGFSKEFLWSEIIKKAFGFTAFFSCLPHGITWICVSIGIYACMDMIISVAFTQKFLHIRWTEQLRVVVPVFGLALLSGIVAWVATYCVSSDWAKLIVGTLSGISIYIIGSYLLKFKELEFALNYFKHHKDA
ncbi:MAG: lipopolysaccharide biosynthesis protein [Bacteroidales bacterium]|jgi:O-antigen/teichoic acid export membrane protein|nr:lipopolysaccharide biosynthesis protein [Bacteroidales bacterium]